MAHPSSLPQVILLVGPKGSGKTTLGRMLEQRPGVHFLEVEAIARRVLAEAGGVIDEHYARRAFSAILEALRAIEANHRAIVLETTGASEHSAWFVEEIRARYALTLVRVKASADVCAQRIATRDSARQVPVDAALVQRMHAATESLAWSWDVVLENDPPLRAADVEAALATCLP